MDIRVDYTCHLVAKSSILGSGSEVPIQPEGTITQITRDKISQYPMGYMSYQPMNGHLMMTSVYLVESFA